MARVTPTEYADKWARRLSAAGEDIRNGINKVTTAPGELAAAQQDALLANFAESVNSGVWASRVRGVSLEDWKKAALDKGVPRIPQGVEAAKPKMARVAVELLAAVDAAAAAANALPKGTLDNSIARMTTFVREMHRRAPKRAGV